MSSSVLILCSKCSKPATDADARCRHCEGALLRVCGDCKFKNSMAKRFCDRCGTRLRPDTTVSKRPKGREPEQAGAPGETLGTGLDPFRTSAQKSAQAKMKAEPLYRPSGTSEVSASRNPTIMARRGGGRMLSSWVAAVDGARRGYKMGRLLLTLAVCAAVIYGAVTISLQIYRSLQPDAAEIEIRPFRR